MAKDVWHKIQPKDFESGKIWDYRGEGEKSSLEGKFLGTKTIKRDEEDDLILHQIEDKDGLRDVWGAYVLDQRMKEVPRGAICRITYGGKIEPKKKGGNAYHAFEVEYKDAPAEEKKKEDAPELPFDE